MNELHEQALSLLTDEFTSYQDLRTPTEELTGYEHPYNIFSDLCEWGLAERQVEQLYGAGNTPRGWRAHFRLAQ